MPDCREEQVDYVEAHGTGTRAGDPVELGALAAVLGEGREPQRHAFVGSLKTNIGHTEAAAGVAGLIKTALALHHDAIPPSLHHKTPNPLIPWADLPLIITTHPRVLAETQWSARRRREWVRYRAEPTPMSCSKRHLPRLRDRTSFEPGRRRLLPLSAKSPEALRTLATRVADLLEF